MSPQEYDAREHCPRFYAMCHGDEFFHEIACTCEQCDDAEAAADWIDALAMQHPDLDSQWRWYDLIEMYGYDLPAHIWRHVEDTMREWMAEDARQAEERAGWIA